MLSAESRARALGRLASVYAIRYKDPLEMLACDAAGGGSAALCGTLLADGALRERLTVTLIANTSGGWLPAAATCRPKCWR